MEQTTSASVWPTGPAVLLGMHHGDPAILHSTYGDGVLMLYSWLAAGVPTDVLVRAFDRIPVAEGR
jgi:hypothetical protein